MSDIRNNRRPKNNRRVNGMQRKNTMEAVNSASSVVRTSGTDAANTGEVTLVKNEDYQVLIEDMGNDGEGIGHVQGMTVFVKDAVVGDLAEVKIVKVKKNIAYGRLMKLITPSPYRVEPVCDKAKRCGGCTMQQVSYEQQLEYKWNKVKNCLQRIGKMENVEAIMEKPAYGMNNPFHYRNKAQFPVGRDKNGNVVIGFYAGRSHDIIDTESCAIGAPVNDQIVAIVRSFIEDNHISTYDEETGRGLVRHILIRVGFTTKEIMVCLVTNGNKLPHSEILIDELVKIDGMTSICLNVNMENTNRILGDKCITLWGQSYITDYIGDIKYQISPLSFYQVNPVQTNVLYNKALEYADLSGDETVWDMYCGIGTISLFLAQKAKKVYGVEIVPQAIDDARHNAEINGITNAEFFVGKAEEVVPDIYKKGGDGSHADVVVVDPPRKGCDQVLLDTLVHMAPERIVYVSCDPATLARDVKILQEKGYEAKKVAVVDQFCHSGHVETVVLLSHKKPDSVINVKVEFGEGEGKIPLDNIEKRAESYKPKERVTYKMIKEYIEAKHGFKVHTAYIAEVKRDLGLPMYDAPNAVEELKQPRKHPTPEKVEAIKDALKHFEVI
jgi:23S rRNA (uracil1939-C5)-methyltransferase